MRGSTLIQSAGEPWDFVLDLFEELSHLDPASVAWIEIEPGCLEEEYTGRQFRDWDGNILG